MGSFLSFFLRLGMWASDELCTDEGVGLSWEGWGLGYI